jgi:diguanylate cyclase
MAEAPIADQEAVSRELRHLIESNEKLQGALDKAESKMHEQARIIADYAARVRTDTLTQVLNRGAFDEELVRRVSEWHRRERPFTVIMLDVDQFKLINDRFGHQAGDQVLQYVAQVLRNTLREMDLLARFGGDEFAILLPDTNLGEATQAAERLRERIEGFQVPVDGLSLSLTVSLGLAEVLPSDDDETVLSRADEALYAAKESGRNRCCYHDGGQTATLPLGGTEAGLPEAAPMTSSGVLDSPDAQKGDWTGVLPIQSPEVTQTGIFQAN